MALYFIEYELRKQRSYQPFFDALNALGARRYLRTGWWLNHSDTSCVALREHLKSYIDVDDSLMVSRIGEWASYNGMSTPA